jgi:hypothetical protein
VTSGNGDATSWQKSSYSGANSNCTEVRRLNGRLAVRDSKTPESAALDVPNSSWTDFLSALKRDHLG